LKDCFCANVLDKLSLEFPQMESFLRSYLKKNGYPQIIVTGGGNNGGGADSEELEILFE
jgi:hypothetical protein